MTTIYTINSDGRNWQTNSADVAERFARDGHRVTATTGAP